MRLGEIYYLIGAEAKANGIDLQKITLSYLNLIIRNREAGSLAISDQNSILSAIRAEKRHELFCEWGNRWFDLKRWNQATAILGPLKTGWSATDQLYPIPVSEINANPACTKPRLLKENVIKHIFIF